MPTRFTRKDLMVFPAGTVLELPLWTAECCGRDVYPFEQGRHPSEYGGYMRLCHYQCGSCGRVWGSYHPTSEGSGQ